MHFRNVFSSHMLSHQFGMAIKDGCETVVHGIRFALDLHFDWVVFQVDVMKTFNTTSCKAIFQKLRATKGQLN